MSHKPRRWAVEGRTSCIHCRQMLRSPSGITDHARSTHPETVFDYSPRIGTHYHRRWSNGGLRCYAKSPPKIPYESLEKARLAAMLIFINRGFVLEPYYCYASTHRGHRGVPKYIRGCGQWHLSRKVRMLSA